MSEPKLYEILWVMLNEWGDEGFWDAEHKVFLSREEAEEYGRSQVEYDEDGDPINKKFLEVNEVTEIDGYEINLTKN